MRIDFYHLTAKPLEQVLPSICEKLLGSGERLLIVAGENRVEALDRQLWTFAPDSFLPHGRAGASREAEQPILVSSEPTAANGARNVALADGEWRDSALAFERVFYFFDGATIIGARSAWKALKTRDGAERHYWKQDETGRWVEGP
ncbi:MAG: polymerase subunit chi [Alphaproteobacteria bacterium]|nr:polymerase subunit chi [Alphaproteobacteria bacterium]